MDRIKNWITTKNVLLFFLSIIIFLAAFLGSEQYEKIAQDSVKDEVSADLEIHVNSVESILKRRLGLIDGLERFVVSRNDQEIQRDFQIFASGLQNEFEGVRNVGIAPGGILSLIYPVEGNEGAINYNLLTDETPSVKVDIARTIGSGEMVVSDPFELRQGGLAIAGRKAIYKDNGFWGIVSVVVDVPIVISYSGLSKDSERYTLALRDKTGKIFWGNLQTFQSDPVVKRIDTVDGYWEIGGVTKDGWSGTTSISVWIARLVLFTIGLLILLLASLLLNRNATLTLVEEKAEERARSLKIILIYAAVSAVWIFLSDLALITLFRDPEIVSGLQTVKGWLFVGVTSMLLYWLIEVNFNKYLITSRALKLVLSGSKLLSRSNNEKELLQGACDQITSSGEYGMAWVGLALNDEGKTIGPVAVSGNGKDFFQKVTISRGNNEEHNAPCRLVFKTGKCVYINDTDDEKFSGAWHLEVVRRGFRSVLAIPLKNQGETFGVLGIYATKENAFSPGDIEILLSFANDLVVGLRSLKLKREIERNLELMNQVLRDMGDGVVVTDKNGIITLVNKELVRITEKKKRSLLKKKFDEVVELRYEKNNEPVKDLVGRVINKGKEIEPKDAIYLKSKEYKNISTDVLATPIRDVNDKVVGSVVIMRDVTKKRQLEKMRSDFVSLASHQLRSPLTGIKWFVQLLADNISSMTEENILDHVKKIGDSNERLIDLVNDLLQTSRMEGGKYKDKKLESMSLKKLMKEAVSLQAGLLDNKSIKIKGLEGIPSELEVEMDKVQMMQVFVNLINNAINYSPKGSEIVIEVKKEKKDVTISLEDHGYGIPKAQENKIFIKFYRADNVANKVPGSGLGLYITKGLVEGHGGEIWFKSEENKGTTFFVKLPIKQKKHG